MKCLAVFTLIFFLPRCLLADDVFLKAEDISLEADISLLNHNDVLLELNDDSSFLNVVLDSKLNLKIAVKLTPEQGEVFKLLVDGKKRENLWKSLKDCLLPSPDEKIEVEPQPIKFDSSLDLDKIIDGLKNNQIFVNACNASDVSDLDLDSI